MGIRDVAKLAGVGVGTVSRVLNNSQNVSEDARRRIEQAMRELNYVPNELARNLFRKRSNLIGLMIPNVEHPFFGTLTRFVETELYQRGYKMMLCNTIRESGRERQYLEMLNRNIMDGVIVASHSINMKEYERIGKPIVSFDRMIGGGIPIVSSDHAEGGRKAGEKFLRDGCRHAVQIMGSREVDTPAHLHHTVFEQVMRQGGGHVNTVEMARGLFDYADYEAAAREVFERYPDADAVYGADLSVCACMAAARRRGRRIPDDLEVIAYDGTYVTRLTSPELTAVAQPVEQLARAAAGAVTNLVETGELSEELLPLPVELRPGGTTRPEG